VIGRFCLLVVAEKKSVGLRPQAVSRTILPAVG